MEHKGRDWLESHLIEGETALAQIEGREERAKIGRESRLGIGRAPRRGDGNKVIVVATERRVLFVTKFWFSEDLRMLPYVHISSVSKSGSWLKERLEIATQSEHVSILYPTGDVGAFSKS